MLRKTKSQPCVSGQKKPPTRHIENVPCVAPVTIITLPVRSIPAVTSSAVSVELNPEYLYIIEGHRYPVYDWAVVSKSCSSSRQRARLFDVRLCCPLDTNL